MFTRVLFTIVLGIVFAQASQPSKAALPLQPVSMSAPSHVSPTVAVLSSNTEAGVRSVSVSRPSPVVPSKAPLMMRALWGISAAAALAIVLGWLRGKVAGWILDAIASRFWAAIGRGIAVKAAVQLAARGLLADWMITALEGLLFFA